LTVEHGRFHPSRLESLSGQLDSDHVLINENVTSDEREQDWLAQRYQNKEAAHE